MKKRGKKLESSPKTHSRPQQPSRSKIPVGNADHIVDLTRMKWLRSMGHSEAYARTMATTDAKPPLSMDHHGNAMMARRDPKKKTDRHRR